MAKQETHLMLSIGWDDEIDDHPTKWDIPMLIRGDPFSVEHGLSVKVVSFTDVKDEPG